MVGDYVGGWEGASVSRWGERDSRFHGNDGLGRRDDGEEGRGPFDVPQGERNPVPPGSPFERLRASGSRFPPVHPSISLRANGSQAPRFALREPQGERNPVPPSAQAQARPFESLRANGTRFPPVHPSGGSGQALRGAQGERNTIPPGSPFGRLRTGPSRGSGRAEHGSPRSPFARLKTGPSRGSGRAEHGSPRFTLRQAQGRPFESLRANGTRLPPVHPSAGSGQALREPQGERNTVAPG